MAVYLGLNEVNMVGGQPIIVEGVDTSDATATADDILSGKTAYVGDVKVTGTYTPLDTSDATATAEYIFNGRTAYVNGVKIVGTNTNNASVNATMSNEVVYPSYDDVSESGNYIVFRDYPFARDYKVTADTYLDIYIDKRELGDATVADVLSGKTFTSSSGFKVEGTASAGLAVKSGTTTSATIDTGLSSVSYFMLYKSSVAATGLIQAIYDGSTTNITYCSSYSTWSKAYAVGTATPTISGGTITWNITTASSGGLSSNTTYNWIAFGTE